MPWYLAVRSDSNLIRFAQADDPVADCERLGADHVFDLHLLAVFYDITPALEPGWYPWAFEDVLWEVFSWKEEPKVKGKKPKEPKAPKSEDSPKKKSKKSKAPESECSSLEMPTPKAEDSDSPPIDTFDIPAAVRLCPKKEALLVGEVKKALSKEDYAWVRRHCSKAFTLRDGKQQRVYRLGDEFVKVE
jgi:hypothetical protein